MAAVPQAQRSPSSAPGPTSPRRTAAAASRLCQEGVALLPRPFGHPDAVRRAAQRISRQADRRSPLGVRFGRLELVGEFVIPPPLAATRDFQALHFDFGRPLDPRGARDVARFTALHIPHDHGPVEARTRLVRLDQALRQRRWAQPGELIRRFERYGMSHGAWDAERGYSEGIFARLVEAADDREPVLPSVSATPGFLCGTEFASAGDERRFFEDHGLSLDEAETVVALQPGELLVFDNLAWAHGRRGRRRPGELHQWMFGYRALSASRQRVVRRQLLEAFAP